jgi:hypothetical protein
MSFLTDEQVRQEIAKKFSGSGETCNALEMWALDGYSDCELLSLLKLELKKSEYRVVDQLNEKKGA